MPETNIIILKGEFSSRRVWLDGKLLSPRKSQEVYNHSPDGFNWGYGGSGPAQLALAILLEFTDKDTALTNYQNFKWNVIACLPQADFERQIDVSVFCMEGVRA
jgi:hypothetical protein